jgi:hypothetical protein
MPLHKFGKSDILYNQIKTHPSSTFFIYDSNIYYNNRAVETGKNVTHVPGVPVGHVNLLELNVDRANNDDLNSVIGVSGSIASLNVKNNGFIYPFVIKGLSQVAFRDMTREEFNNDFDSGDILTGSYKMSSSISRQRYLGSHNFLTTNHTGSALKNSLDYAKRLGQHYGLDDSGGLNVIQIPSIFYGSEIKKGTVDLKYYITGNVVGRLKDSRQDGALIQSAGTEGLDYNDEIAGVVLYKEGFIILSGSWNLATTFTNATKIGDKDYTGTAVAAANSSWLNFGFGANDKISGSTGNLTNGSASFSIDFAGTHKIPTVTMMAHANKGELNYSNNPTYVKSGQDTLYSPITGSHLYREQQLEIKNIHSASYADPSGSLVKTTYITKVGIYDEKRKLIGIASLANPVKKTENRDLTFKLKLDI